MRRWQGGGGFFCWARGSSFSGRVRRSRSAGPSGCRRRGRGAGRWYRASRGGGADRWMAACGETAGRHAAGPLPAPGSAERLCPRSRRLPRTSLEEFPGSQDETTSWRLGSVRSAGHSAIRSLGDLQLLLDVRNRRVAAASRVHASKVGLWCGSSKVRRARVQSAAAATSSVSCGRAPTSAPLTSSIIPATSWGVAVSVSRAIIPGTEYGSADGVVAGIGPAGVCRSRSDTSPPSGKPDVVLHRGADGLADARVELGHCSSSVGVLGRCRVGGEHAQCVLHGRTDRPLGPWPVWWRTSWPERRWPA